MEECVRRLLLMKPSFASWYCDKGAQPEGVVVSMTGSLLSPLSVPKSSAVPPSHPLR